MIRSIALLLVVVMLGACAGATASSPGPKTVTIDIHTFQFSPAMVEVPVGTTVVWRNGDDILHTATSGTSRSSGLGTFDASPDGRFDGRMDGAGTEFRFRFEQAGTYTYYCDRHRHMTATVVVK
ncbi:MAG: plastocyanin/azurin family copper-binding protein [Chloroflexota bacterium]|nr:plastocyanin/azurin family copper-binding protein [Chloroflexota bacterium]